MEADTEKTIDATNQGFRVGSIVFDKFEILQSLGAGAYGSVYKAKARHLDSIVALKVLNADSKNERRLIRFQNEARNTSRLKHKNIATVLDFGFEQNTPYLIMEFVEGDTLAKLIEENGVLSYPLFFAIMLSVSQAVSHAHSQSVIHRDLKPANIIVQTNDDGVSQVKVLDFGISKRIDEEDLGESKLTAKGDIIGSPLYMSPEQARGEGATAKSDNYSLGCIMWECLTGSPPFRADTALETLLMHQNSPVPQWSKFREDSESVPIELRNLVEQLLDKNPANRPNLEKDVIPTLVTLESTIGPALTSPVDSETSTESSITGKKHNQIVVLFVIFALLALAGGIFISSATKPIPVAKINDSINREMVADGFEVDFDEKKMTKRNAPVLVRDDEGLKEYVSLKRNVDRQSLELVDIDITDKGIDCLVGLPLTTLNIKGTQVRTLKNINGIKGLEILNLKDTKISDASLNNLIGLSRLRLLILSGTPITDLALNKLAAVQSLRNIDLSNTGISGRSFEPLRKLPYLRVLTLEGIRVIPKAVRQLASMKAMEKLIIPNLSKEEEQAFAQEYPTVSFNGLPSVYETKMSTTKRAIKHTSAPDLTNIEECLAIARLHYGEDSEQVTNCLSDMTTAYMLRNDLTNARIYLGKTKKNANMTKPSLLALGLIETEINLNALTTQVDNHLLLAKGTEFANRLFVELEKDGDKIKHLYPHYISLGTEYMRQKQFAKARQSYTCSYEICRKTLGEDSLPAACAQLLLANILEKEKKYDEAAVINEQAISTINKAKRKETIGPLRDIVVTGFSNYSFDKTRSQEFDEALYYNELATRNCQKGNHIALAELARQKASILKLIESKKGKVKATPPAVQ